MDAILVYSDSLEAINDAVAHRKENASGLVNSVQQLVSAVPGYGAAFNSAGTLIIKGLGMTVEVKAWHDMRRAVETADPAIQLVAQSLKQDFEELSRQFEAPLNDQLAKLGAEIRPVIRFEKALREKRDAQRTEVEKDPGDSAKGAELARLDVLYVSAAADLDRMRSKRAEIENSIAQGREFFADASAAVDAWANAHAEIVKAFKEKRMPDFALLITRAEEVNEIVNQIKTNKAP
jgi:hypothetical protein